MLEECLNENIMSPKQLFNYLCDKNDLFLVDVRGLFELDTCRIENAMHIPMQSIPDSIELFPKDKNLVMICHHGLRSNMAVQFLKNKGINRVFNLDEGIDRWAVEVDNKIPRY